MVRGAMPVSTKAPLHAWMTTESVSDICEEKKNIKDAGLLFLKIHASFFFIVFVSFDRISDVLENQLKNKNTHTGVVQSKKEIKDFNNSIIRSDSLQCRIQGRGREGHSSQRYML